MVVTEGSGIGPFQCAMSDLSVQTTYYIRSYATNSLGLTGYGNQVTLNTPAPCPATVTDIDGNVYPVVQIGGQCWMADNLRVTRYSDGASIAYTNPSSWISFTSGIWTNYQTNSVYDVQYGKLYNWFAVADSRGVCPEGWHVPSDTDWQLLEVNLGMPSAGLNQTGWRGSAQNVGGKMKSTQLWNAPNIGATNESGVTMVPSGTFYSTNNGFYGLGDNGSWWSSTEADVDRAWVRELDYSSEGVGRSSDNGVKTFGHCLRCLRD